MAALKDILSEESFKAVKVSQIKPGSIFHGPMEGVDHGKFYIIAGISGDKYCVCTVVINSKINQFISNRPKLKERQIPILEKDYPFLDHDSFINCAQPLSTCSELLHEDLYEFKDVLKSDDLSLVVKHIKESGALSEEEIDLFFTKL